MASKALRGLSRASASSIKVRGAPEGGGAASDNSRDGPDRCRDHPGCVQEALEIPGIVVHLEVALKIT
eukprot:11429470-Alexandrium_andersonii.AAC.1